MHFTYGVLNIVLLGKYVVLVPTWQKGQKDMGLRDDTYITHGPSFLRVHVFLTKCLGEAYGYVPGDFSPVGYQTVMLD
jgi:hypothetical protein